MLDVVFTAMFAVLPALLASIYLVRFRRRYRWHKRMQLVIAGVLLVAVTAFEVDMRLHGWQHLARPSPYWREGPWNDWVDYSLAIHLTCAIPTLVLWVVVSAAALWRFPVPPTPSAHSRWHRRYGATAVVGLVLTAVTGWMFYWLAFAAGG